MSGRYDALAVDQMPKVAPQHLVQRKAQIMGTSDGLSFLCSSVQAINHREGASPCPNFPVTADMLKVKAGKSFAGPVPPKVAVAVA